MDDLILAFSKLTLDLTTKVHYSKTNIDFSDNLIITIPKCGDLFTNSFKFKVSSVQENQAFLNKDKSSKIAWIDNLNKYNNMRELGGLKGLPFYKN